jgi:hypothetical protein
LLSIWPNDAAWYVLSDYCIGDKSKSNDAATFSILLNHDTLGNLKDFVAEVAPKDIKSSRSISDKFIYYINQRVMFHVTFVVPSKLKFLKRYADVDNMLGFLSPFRQFVIDVASKSTFEAGFEESVLKRIALFTSDFQRSNFNANLSRKIYLVACFASLVFYYLAITKQPHKIFWISDRDAITERYGGIIFDFAYFMFLYEYMQILVDNRGVPSATIDKPQFIFATATKENAALYDELIRIPDHIAGTMADFNMQTSSFSKAKFRELSLYSLTNAENHAIIQVSGDRSAVSSRRLIFHA